MAIGILSILCAVEAIVIVRLLIPIIEDRFYCWKDSIREEGYFDAMSDYGHQSPADLIEMCNHEKEGK